MAASACAVNSGTSCRKSIWNGFTPARRGGTADDHSDHRGTRRQFLPAALEVQDTPPSPTGRWLLWLLLSLFIIGVAWASVGKVDIVVTAPGRIVPSGQVKRVQAPESGTVVAILASEGERVAAGQALIRLDTTYADADDRRIREQLNSVALQSTWRRTLDHWLVDGGSIDTAPALPLHFAAAEQAEAESLYRLHRVEIGARMRDRKSVV